MRLPKFFIISFLLFCISGLTHGQYDDTLSNSNLGGKDKAIILYGEAMALYDKGELDQSLNLSKIAIAACEEQGMLDGVAQLLLNMGKASRVNGDYQQSLKYLFMSNEHFQTLGILSGQASALNEIGAIYRLQGNYSEALEFFFNSLKLYQQISDSTGTAITFNNIGIIYFYQNNFQKSLEYYLASLELELIMEDDYGISISYINVGEVYKNLGQYDKALDYFLKALVLAKKSEDRDTDGDSIGILYNEIGSIYSYLGDYGLSQSYLLRALEIFIEIENKQRLAECQIYLAELSQKKHAIEKAKTYLYQALANANEISALDIIVDANQKLSRIFEGTNETEKAFYYYKNYIEARDSIFNKDQMKQMVQTEMLYKFEKEMQQANLEQTKRDILVKENARRQKLVRNFLIFAFTVLLIIAVIIYSAFKTKQRINRQLNRQQKQILEKNEELLQQQEEILSQRDEIEKKNQTLEHSQRIIEDKNDRIISSIEYAQTIQQAILPNRQELSRFFPNHLVFFKPKDIVSGDFYWFSAVDNLLFAAVVDCTGHGVPGAFMSLIGNTLLDQIVSEWGTKDPALILEVMHKEVRHVLNQDTSNSKAHASMDICLIAIDTVAKKATFAGASRPLFLVKNGEITRINGDPRSVGGFQLEKKRYFTNHTIDISQEILLYLTTDGFTDQMNPSFKKFSRRKFVQLIESICALNTKEQYKAIEQAFEEHRQGYEQIDDVCILGINLNL